MPEESAPAVENQNPNPPVATIAEIGRHEGQSVTLRGWLYNLRESGKLLFPIFRDGTGSIQGVAHVKSVTPEVFEALKGLTQESSVIVTGKVRADKRAPGGYELDVEDIQVVQRVPESDPYPITLKEHGVDFLQERRHLWVRSPRQSAILRIRAEIMRAAAEYFDSNGFIRTDPPILTPAACEGTSTLFPGGLLRRSRVPDAERPALHRVDGAGAGQGVQLRADVPRGEVEDASPPDGVLDGRARGCLHGPGRADGTGGELHLAHRAERPEEPRAGVAGDRTRQRRSSKTIKPPFPRLRYDEAAEMLNQAHKDGQLEAPFEYGNDFGSPDETWLSSQYDRPVMVHRYPADVKAFYMEPDPKDPRYALCVDVLAPEGYGEIIGGSQRVSSYELLSSRIDQHKLPREAFEWYLDLRRYGSVPHAGFGMGIERVVAWVCALDHVRETIPFPRMLHRMYP